MGKMNLPKYLLKRTDGPDAKLWCRFEHPLLAKCVYKSTGIPATDLKAAKTFSDKLGALIRAKKNTPAARATAFADDPVSAAIFYDGVTTPAADAKNLEFNIQYDVPPWNEDDEHVIGGMTEVVTKLAGNLSEAVQARENAETANANAQIENKKLQEEVERLRAMTGDDLNPAPAWAEAVKEYLADLKANGGRKGGCSPVHLRQRERHLAEFWATKLVNPELRKIDVAAVGRVLTTLSADVATKTVQTHLESLRAFLSWAERVRYIRVNPLVAMKNYDSTPETDRRNLTADELKALIAAAPTDRKLIYRLAVVTGYRKGELAALKVSDFDAAKKTLRVDGRHTKNKKDATQLLPSWLCSEVARLAIGKSPTAPLLQVDQHIDRLFKKDLEKAGITAGEGEQVVFHSLRHSTATLLSGAGATTKEQMDLMRHSDPRLTVGTYTHSQDKRLAELVEELGKAVS